MSYLLLGYERTERDKLTEEQKEQIINNIGVFTEFASSISNAAAHGAANEVHSESLSFAAAFMAEVAGELNGILQKVPKAPVNESEIA